MLTLLDRRDMTWNGKREAICRSVDIRVAPDEIRILCDGELLEFIDASDADRQCMPSHPAPMPSLMPQAPAARKADPSKTGAWAGWLVFGGFIAAAVYIISNWGG
jgi:hypothetical protein